MIHTIITNFWKVVVVKVIVQVADAAAAVVVSSKGCGSFATSDSNWSRSSILLSFIKNSGNRSTTQVLVKLPFRAEEKSRLKAQQRKHKFPFSKGLIMYVRSGNLHKYLRRPLISAGGHCSCCAKLSGFKAHSRNFFFFIYKFPFFCFMGLTRRYEKAV